MEHQRIHMHVSTGTKRLQGCFSIVSRHYRVESPISMYKNESRCWILVFWSKSGSSDHTSPLRHPATFLSTPKVQNNHSSAQCWAGRWCTDFLLCITPENTGSRWSDYDYASRWLTGCGSNWEQLSHEADDQPPAWTLILPVMSAQHSLDCFINLRSA